MNRRVDHWLTEGCVLNPPPEVDDPYKEEAEDHWRAGRVDAPEWGKRANGKLSGVPKYKKKERQQTLW